MQPQPMPNPLGIVGPVSCQPPRPSADPSRCPRKGHLFQHRFDLRRLVGLARCQTGIKRHAVAITQEMDLGTEAAYGSSQRMVARFGCIVAFFRRARSGAVRADDSSIQRPLLPINGALRVKFDLEGLQDAIPGASAPPPGIPVVDRFPFAIPFWNIRPRGTGMQPPEDTIDNGPMRVPRMADLAIIGR
jgi:hypothetical protein